ncbi:MAG: hypothetical protein A2W93_06730 [Bacteroidetes bacterium GWF2_43_63]|nr:MAG: hypothetical protein A2W94_07805 [Bacteroidetes bacterium GWE2_42_42]OFY53314.1 MAG: hypothetical protein A2W93_06730 [Bacteroidetes bacterium GWF2_43_63]HBG71691.1 hypothetical protein [Bacteroidales bacterium]HCB61644.1 hypothetical protein [Bacteroidales bacterium]HCY22856.1 hypothetical protein [Bacteroidales bacterium]
MKYFFILILSFFSLQGFSVNNDTLKIPDIYEVNDKISDAIRSGDASQLAACFAPTIQLSVPGKKGDFSRTQAEIIMRDFFSQYPPSSFTVNSEGKTSGTNYYTLGSYVSGAIRFKVYYVIQKADSEITLHILKFEIQ